MRLGRRFVILLPDLDGLIRLSADQPEPRLIERARKDATLRIQRPWLGSGIQALVSMARLPIPERNRTVIAAGEEHIVFIHAKGVDDGILTFEILHEGAFGTFPLLDGVCAAAGERPLDGMLCQGSHAFLVMREHAHCLAGGQIPEANSSVE